MAPACPAAARPALRPGRPGRPATSRRALVNAILDVLWIGYPWRALPDCYPHWGTVHHHVARWAPASTQDRDGGRRLKWRLRRHVPNIRLVWADAG